jgi:DNA-binding Lrp family transcriptional regulator
MKKHNGMRPQDIVVLLDIIVREEEWTMKDISQELNISGSEVSESLQRSYMAGLIDGSKKNVMRNALMEFLKYGLRYVFPQTPGAIVRGIPTAYSAPPLSDMIMSSDKLVWAYPKGEVRGQSVEPLYPTVVKSALHNPKLYEMLALVDALRVGRVRERELAAVELETRVLDGW